MITRLGPHTQWTDPDKERLFAYLRSNPYPSATVLSGDIEYYHGLLRESGVDVPTHLRVWAFLPVKMEFVEEWAQAEALRAVDYWRRYGRPFGGLVSCISVGCEFILESWGGRASKEAYEIANIAYRDMTKIAKALEPSIVIYSSLTSQPWYNLCGPDRNQEGWYGLEVIRESLELCDGAIVHGYTTQSDGDAGLDPGNWQFYYQCFAYFREPGHKDRTEGVDAGDPGGGYYDPIMGKMPWWWSEFNCEVTNRQAWWEYPAGTQPSETVAQKFKARLAQIDQKGLVEAVDWFVWNGDDRFVVMFMLPYHPLQTVWQGWERQVSEPEPEPDEPSEQMPAQQAVDIIWGILNQVRLLTIPLFRQRLRVSVRKDVASHLAALANEGQAHLLTIKEELE